MPLLPSHSYDEWDDKQKGMDPGPWVPVQAGMNRFVWNLRYPGAVRVRGTRPPAKQMKARMLCPAIPRCDLPWVT